MIRMKLTIAISLCCLLAFTTTTSQTVVTAVTFPQAGDTLKILVAQNPSVQPGSPGPDQNWDFSGLSSQYANHLIYLEATAGDFSASFRDAQSMTNVGNIGETYFKNTATQFQNLGSGGSDPAGLSLTRVNRFAQPFVERRAPLMYNPNQAFSTSGTYSFRFSINDLPSFIADSILARIPFRVDSMGLGVRIARTDLVDAWGRLSIPGGNYQVLRERREESRSIALEVKLPVIGWRDVTDLIAIAGGFGNIGADTTLSYHFWSNEAKAPIAVLRMSADGNSVVTVEYKDNDRLSSMGAVNLSKPGVSVYPNPAIDEVRFDFVGLAAGTYTLKIFNILGRQVWQDTFDLTGTRSEIVDLSQLKKGTYLYNLSNERGKTVITKRLMIVRP